MIKKHKIRKNNNRMIIIFEVIKNLLSRVGFRPLSRDFSGDFRTFYIYFGQNKISQKETS
jgi:hypothetical protein